MDLLNNLILGFGVAFTLQNLLYALGGAVLGSFADRHGRRAGMTWCSWVGTSEASVTAGWASAAASPSTIGRRAIRHRTTIASPPTWPRGSGASHASSARQPRCAALAPVLAAALPRATDDINELADALDHDLDRRPRS